MKKLSLIAVIFISSFALIMAQPCPDSLYLTSQAQVDSFQILYPNCTQIEGDVIINGFDITNLYGLGVLTSINGKLMIGEWDIGNSFNPVLTSLSGLEGLTSIGANLEILSNETLNSLAGLENLISIGGHVLIRGNDSLTSVMGLNNVTSIGNYLEIRDNDSLTSLTGLDNVTSINGPLFILDNDALTSLSGLENVTSIGGGEISNNNTLTSLSGIDNLTSIENNFGIQGNAALTNLTGLDNVTSMGGCLSIAYNDALTSLSELNNVTSIGRWLTISNNDALTSLEGLDNVTTIGQSVNISENDALTNLTGLENVTSIGGQFWIEGNNALMSLTGLDNIVAASIEDLTIFFNPALSTCEVQSVCDYLASPNGTIVIHDNAPGCNSPEEVIENCENNCLPEGITFTTQEQIDSFQINYPGCTEIEGDVTINGDDIINLDGLIVLTSIHGSLNIGVDSWPGGCPNLISLNGLSSLEYIGGDFSCRQNASLKNLSGLGNLTVIDGYLIIQRNDSLVSLEGLEALIYVGEDVWISFNPLITNLEGLNMLRFIGGDFLNDNNSSLMNFQGLNSLTTIMGSVIIGCINSQAGGVNPSLISFEGFENLALIGGNLEILYNPVLTNFNGFNSLSIIQGELGINHNDTLLDLTGLESLQVVNSIEISANPQLNSLSGIDNIDPGSVNVISIFSNPELYHCGVQSVCEYLISPMGEVNIFFNATGCNNPAEIANQCGTTLPCLAYGNYYLTSQAEVDSFQYLYPGCSEIEGSLNIGGTDITNLEGLNVINSINGDLEIGFLFHGWDIHNPLLESLHGLDNLTNVGGFVQIWYNSSLPDLSGLEQLTEIGEGLHIFRNDVLVSLDGLDDLETIGGYLGLIDNDNLISLAGFENITTVGGDIFITYNDALTSLMGLDNIDAGTIADLKIYLNSSLSACDAQSICDYLVAPNGTVEISNNATGCNSPEEVQDSCEAHAGIVDLSMVKELLIYPNPTHSTINIELQTQHSKNTTLTLSSTNGQQIITQRITKPQTEIDISHLPTGIYIIKVWNDKEVMVQKVIKQ